MTEETEHNSGPSPRKKEETNMTVLSHQRAGFDRLLTGRTPVPAGFDRTVLPEALREKVAAYDSLLTDLATAAAAETARLEAAIRPDGRAPATCRTRCNGSVRAKRLPRRPPLPRTGRG